MYAKQLSVGNAQSVDPDDGTDITPPTRALWVGSAGNIAVVMEGGGEVTFVGVQTGTLLPVAVTRVKSTGTTASSILACYDS